MNWSHIVLAIQAHGLSQPQIAAKCGCAQSTISDIATGRTKDPRFSIGEALWILAKALGISVDLGPGEPIVLAHQAPAAINTEAQGVAHA